MLHKDKEDYVDDIIVKELRKNSSNCGRPPYRTFRVTEGKSRRISCFLRCLPISLAATARSGSIVSLHSNSVKMVRDRFDVDSTEGDTPIGWKFGDARCNRMASLIDDCRGRAPKILADGGVPDD